MSSSKNLGTCLLCSETISHRTITKHLSQCIEKSEVTVPSSCPDEKEKIFLIKVFAGKLFWLYIEINGKGTLDDLDYFLRHIWLECCGHMSQFVIDNEYYDENEGNMNKPIHRLFNIDTSFDYSYDFGSTTELEGKVISVRPGKLSNVIRLVARNNLPEEIVCTTCQKIAEVICSYCGDLFCEECRKTHNSCEDDEYMLPVVNSPRMGVCGYSGDNDSW
jgi:hypothetical protein